MSAVVAVVAIALLGTAAWFGKGLFTSPPTGSPSEIQGAAPLTTTPGRTTPAPSTTPTASTTTPASSATTTPPGAATPTTGEADPLDAAVASCRAKWGLQSTARADAYLSLGQWDRHLDVMNDLRAGKITVARAKDLWTQTTVKASENVAAFRAADAALAASKDTCAVDASATGAKADAVRSCAASMKTVDTVLAQARTAIAPWEKHLKDQSHYRAGGMTPAAAESLWRALWRKGLETMPAYQSVAPKGQSATCTLPE